MSGDQLQAMAAVPPWNEQGDTGAASWNRRTPELQLPSQELRSPSWGAATTGHAAACTEPARNTGDDDNEGRRPAARAATGEMRWAVLLGRAHRSSTTPWGCFPEKRTQGKKEEDRTSLIC